ncbi:olfactory receptor 10K1-like [Corvus hawaiiensis]|uniref:olfactory receptor 10K1-like n=1 Tax=Corvus hawaiiensis TaxID=134902 RepID=UPI00201929D7|nr:olfactory receptor 10K1-like [Corvus hawaiiensis]
MQGTLLTVLITTTASVLHMPMYYFLKNLALTEICYRLSIIPNMLMILLMEEKIISFTACALQLNCVILFVTSISYLRIIYAVLQIPLAVGQRKPFSTCAAHLLVVALFYSTAGIIHLQPKASFSSNMKKTVSLSYTVITPMLNPIIYSLRNQEFKQNLKRCTDE